MHVSASIVLLFMNSYDGSCISIYLVGLYLGNSISYMNRSKDEIPFMVVSWWMS